MRICFATHNPYKIKEVADKLGSDFSILNLDDIGCKEDIPENHHTIGENSLAKARYVSDRYHIDCFADDTGLEVDALGGEPGVSSARYAGPGKNSDDNITLLLKNLGKTSRRSARFRTIISLIWKGEAHQFEGIIEGSITHARKGEHGFGYDPVFRPDGFRETFAQMPLRKKNAISHRAMAIEKLIYFLQHQ